MFAGSKTAYFAHRLLGQTPRRLLDQALATFGEVRRGARLAVNLNLNFSGSSFFRSDNRDAASGERRPPDITGRIAGGEVIVEIAGAQIATANPAGIGCARIVIVEPAFVVG